MANTWTDLVWKALSDVNARLILILPGVLAMATLAAVGLAVGWVAGRLARRVARTLAFDRRADTWGLSRALGRIGHTPHAVGRVGLAVFWSIFVVSVTLAVDALAIPGTGRVTDFVLVGRAARPRRGFILLTGWLVLELPVGARADRRRQCPRAGGAAARPGDPVGRPALRRRDGHHPPRHRQGNGARGFRRHLRGPRPDPVPRLRASAGAGSPGRSSIATSAAILTRARRSPTCDPGAAIDVGDPRDLRGRRWSGSRAPVPPPIGSSSGRRSGFEQAAEARSLPRGPRGDRRLPVALLQKRPGQLPRLRRHRSQRLQSRDRKRRRLRSHGGGVRAAAAWASSSTSCPITWAWRATPMPGGWTCSRTGPALRTRASSTSSGRRRSPSFATRYCSPSCPSQYGEVLESGQLQLELDGRRASCCGAPERTCPICPDSYPRLLTHRLEELAARRGEDDDIHLQELQEHPHRARAPARPDRYRSRAHRGAAAGKGGRQAAPRRAPQGVRGDPRLRRGQCPGLQRNTRGARQLRHARRPARRADLPSRRLEGGR